MILTKKKSQTASKEYSCVLTIKEEKKRKNIKTKNKTKQKNNILCAGATAKTTAANPKNVRQYGQPTNMDNVIDLNSSAMSTASAISAIGLESTLTEEFQELKAYQVEVAHQVEKVVDYYGRVKDFVIDELQNGSGQKLIELETFDEERHAAVEMLMDYHEKTAVAVRAYVDERSRRRVKKIHRFINLMKIKL